MIGGDELEKSLGPNAILAPDLNEILTAQFPSSYDIPNVKSVPKVDPSSLWPYIHYPHVSRTAQHPIKALASFILSYPILSYPVLILS